MLEELGLQLGTSATLSVTSLLLNLGIAVLLSLALRWHFKRFSGTLSNRDEFAQVFPFITLTTVLIISVVKASLALSLGLVGALSIVRFRTPIKEPEELAYLFVAIAIGLGLGADQTLPTVVASLAILLIMALFSLTLRGNESKNLYLSLDWPSDAEDSAGRLDQVSETITSHAVTTDLRRFDVRGDAAEATFFVDLADSSKLSALISDLQERFPGIGVTFIDQSRLPSV